VAQRFLDRLGEMQSKSNSVRAPASFADAWSGNLKVEIPSTGVSLDDISRALRGWLSNDTRVTGEVLVEANNLRVAARASGKAPAEATGPAEALDATLQQAAEQFFGQQQPYLYAIYLQNEGRTDEALAVTRSLALTGPPGERAWGFNSWGLRLQRLGFLDEGAARLRDGLRYEHLPSIQFNLMSDQLFRGREGHVAAMLPVVERAYREGLTSERLNPTAVEALLVEIDVMKAASVGDHRAAEASARRGQLLSNYNNNLLTHNLRLAAALAAQHRPREALATLALAPLTDAQKLLFGGPLPIPEVEAAARIASAAAMEDWAGVLREASAHDAWQFERGGLAAVRRRVVSWPWVARARAELGDHSEAERIIAATPLGCTFCLRVRGRIAALQGRAKEADHWYNIAVARAPTLPQAYQDWAEARLMRGDLPKALEAAGAAAVHGPQWAEPLKTSGDVLLRQGKIEAAQFSYAKAAVRAPRWAKLHMQWARALWQLGQREEARSKLNAAAGMDLSPADTRVLRLLLLKAGRSH
jgi:tetratricopeptide (TPR) repeat protein